jgi:menaquinone-9 beta-reductase
MTEQNTYDVAIIGGGLAGLSSAIEFSRKGYSVVLIEKEFYSFHKVCGEYISNESLDFLKGLGIDPSVMKLPMIQEFLLTSPDGNSFHTRLPLGGFGISRFTLDQKLFTIAEDAGVRVLQGSKVESVTFNEGFEIEIQSAKGSFLINSTLCIGSYGKRSNLDIKWKRNKEDDKDKKLQNFIGVKYHIKTNWPQNVIGLHNFENGYCGISKVEEDKYCLCYLVHASMLKRSGNSIARMEEDHLYKNPHLNKIFRESEFLQDFPVTISQINFMKKSKIENHILMTGDAGGMITPLCGNGMSIALHTGMIAAKLGDLFLKQEITRKELELKFEKEWNLHFGSRLRNGRILQRFFGSSTLSNGFVRFFKMFPFIAPMVIRQTHGKVF